MCGNGLSRLAQAQHSTGSAADPAATLLAHLGLEIKAEAEVQDLYSRPIHVTEVVPLVTGEHRVPRVEGTEAA